MPLEYEELTGQIISAAIEVHSTLGPGFVESIYQRALAVELRLRHIPLEQEKTIAETMVVGGIGTQDAPSHYRLAEGDRGENRE
jgi:hypothetical protein